MAIDIKLPKPLVQTPHAYLTIATCLDIGIERVTNTTPAEYQEFQPRRRISKGHDLCIMLVGSLTIRFLVHIHFHDTPNYGFEAKVYAPQFGKGDIGCLDKVHERLFRFNEFWLDQKPGFDPAIGGWKCWAAKIWLRSTIGWYNSSAFQRLCLRERSETVPV